MSPANVMSLPMPEPDPLESELLAVTALRRRAARQTELARLGTVESDKTPGVFIRTGEAAIAGRLANAWAALAQEIEDAP
jgi:hypothetical protein